MSPPHVTGSIPAGVLRATRSLFAVWNALPVVLRELLWGLPCLLGIVVACNAFRAPIDLTRNRSQTPDPALLAVCRQLPAVVHITIVAPAEARSVGDQALAAAVGPLQDLVAQCQATGARLTLRTADWKADLTLRDLLERHPEITVPGVLLQMEIQGETRIQSLGLADLARLGRGPDGQTMLESYAQSALHGALTRLGGTHGGGQRLGWVSGHGEWNPATLDAADRRGAGHLAERLRRAGYAIEQLNLRSPPGEGGWPPVWLIAGGEHDWSADEVAQLRHHLQTGGRALLLVERPIGARHRGTDDPLREVWSDLGLVVGADRVVALDHRNELGAAVATQLTPAGKSLLGLTPEQPVIVYEAVSVRSRVGVESSGFSSTPLLCSDSAPRAWAETGRQAPAKFDPAVDLPGPVCVASAVERVREGRKEPVAVVIGDAELIENGALATPGGRSALVWTLASLDWLTGSSSEASPIAPRQIAPVSRPSSPDGSKRVLWTFGITWIAACLSVAAARSRI